MSHQTLAMAVRTTLDRALAADPSVMILGESVGRGGGVAGTTDGLLSRYGSDRVMDLTVAERATVGIATGLGLSGKRVVIELTSAGRLPSVMEALVEAASIARHSEFSVPMVVRVPTGTQAGDRIDRPMVEALCALSSVTVACASCATSAANLLSAGLARGPLVLLEPRSLYRSRLAFEAPKELGKARVLREGDHVVLISWGGGVQVSLEVAEDLAEQGVHAAVVDLLTLSPLDRETIGHWVRHTGRAVVVQPDGGGAAWVEHALLQTSFLYFESPLTVVRALPDAVRQAALDSVHY